MDVDKYALVEKILQDVNNIMIKNAELYAFDIIPVDCNNQNKSPVLHLENCLGLESWCVKHVYLHCYTELITKFIKIPKNHVFKLTSINVERMCKLLNMTLLINPDLSVFWNKRRELIHKSLLGMPSELLFTRLVLSRKPKCNDAFAYRRWMLEAIIQDDSLQSDYIERLINEELRITELASEKSANNYHSWNHRIWLLKKLKAIQTLFNINFLYSKEYTFSEQWTSKHVSDYSCFHYRQFCIKNILALNAESWKLFRSYIEKDFRKSFARIIALNLTTNESHITEEILCSYSEEVLLDFLLNCSSKHCKCVMDSVLVCRQLEVLFYELMLSNELIRFYKSHETLWYHRRYIIHEIIAMIYINYNLVRQNGVLVKYVCEKCNLDEMLQKQVKIVKYDSNRVYNSVLFKVILSHEKNFVEERLADFDNYADRHEKYLKFVKGLNNAM